MNIEHSTNDASHCIAIKCELELLAVGLHGVNIFVLQLEIGISVKAEVTF